MQMAENTNNIYELRFYSVEAGRDRDMRARVQNDLKWLFPRHGIRPVGGWSALAAPELPLFVYITPFTDMIERDRCWTGFYTDPDWQEVRNRTNAGSELVEDYQIWFVREIVGWTQPAAMQGGLDELIFFKTLVGKSAVAGGALRESELPALERSGAVVQGAFDVVSGGTLPGAMAFLRWPNWEARRTGLAALADDAALADRRASERREFGHSLIGRTGSYLLDPVTVDWD
ncbi:NIPSNAP family protein [Sphingomonas sp.]|uniref:NIPSNAP family protein n=1 Tax=Sphingomonas sp. TaxID=28214 RepID=UPI003F724EC5